MGIKTNRDILLAIAFISYFTRRTQQISGYRSVTALHCERREKHVELVEPSLPAN